MTTVLMSAGSLKNRRDEHCQADQSRDQRWKREVPVRKRSQRFGVVDCQLARLMSEDQRVNGEQPDARHDCNRHPGAKPFHSGRKAPRQRQQRQAAHRDGSQCP